MFLAYFVFLLFLELNGLISERRSFLRIERSAQRSSGFSICTFVLVKKVNWVVKTCTSNGVLTGHLCLYFCIFRSPFCLYQLRLIFLIFGLNVQNKTGNIHSWCSVRKAADQISSGTSSKLRQLISYRIPTYADVWVLSEKGSRSNIKADSKIKLLTCTQKALSCCIRILLASPLSDFFFCCALCKKSGAGLQFQ